MHFSCRANKSFLDFVDFNVFMSHHHDDHIDDIIAIVDKGQTMEYLWKPAPI